MPPGQRSARPIGGHLEGCRIGFDAGGGNAPMVSSLFIKVPRGKAGAGEEPSMTGLPRELGDVPIVVANDGDVTPWPGRWGWGVRFRDGHGHGTSEAVGYVDRDGNVLGWLNELAFAPVDLNEEAMVDEWSTDRGVGLQVFLPGCGD